MGSWVPGWDAIIGNNVGYRRVPSPRDTQGAVYPEHASEEAREEAVDEISVRTEKVIAGVATGPKLPFFTRPQPLILSCLDRLPLTLPDVLSLLLVPSLRADRDLDLGCGGVVVETVSPCVQHRIAEVI